MDACSRDRFLNFMRFLFSHIRCSAKALLSQPFLDCKAFIFLVSTIFVNNFLFTIPANAQLTTPDQEISTAAATSQAISGNTSEIENNAVLVSQSVPTTMVAGTAYAVSVTMRNTGTLTWSPNAAYYLAPHYPSNPGPWVSQKSRYRIRLGRITRLRLIFR